MATEAPWRNPDQCHKSAATKTARHARTAQQGGDYFGRVKIESKSAKFANKEVLKDFD